MKKRIIIIAALTLSAALVLAGCAGAKADGGAVDTVDKGSEDQAALAEDEGSEDGVNMGNPWSEISRGEAQKACENLFNVPYGAENTVWSIMRDVEEGYGPLVQLNFEMPGYKGIRFVARAQKTGKEDDISGTYYEWNTADEGKSSKLGGSDISVRSYRYKDEQEMADLLTWFIPDTGISCCLLATGEDLDGFDIQAIAEAMYEGQEGDDPEEDDFDISDVYIEPEDLFDVDIEGCDTLTQIVDRLEDGRGYVNVNIGQSGALLVSSGTYKYDEDTDAAIDARIFDYDDDGKVIDIGSVCAGGTAYPLAVKDGLLYVGGNHFMRLYTIRNHELIITEEVYVEYDGNGNATYHLRKENEDFSYYSSKEAESRFDELFAELGEVEIIGFATVGSGGE